MNYLLKLVKNGWNVLVVTGCIKDVCKTRVYIDASGEVHALTNSYQNYDVYFSCIGITAAY